jgi:hypothetical protein
MKKTIETLKGIGLLLGACGITMIVLTINPGTIHPIWDVKNTFGGYLFGTILLIAAIGSYAKAWWIQKHHRTESAIQE